MPFKRQVEEWSLNLADKRTSRARWIELVAFELFHLRWQKLVADRQMQKTEGVAADMLMVVPTIDDAIAIVHQGLQERRKQYADVALLMEWIHKHKPEKNDVLRDAASITANYKYAARLERYQEVEG